jgi:hypothetical protein
MEFVAVEVFEGISHTYQHDLQRFFYFSYGLVPVIGGRPPIGSQRDQVCSQVGTPAVTMISPESSGEMDKKDFENVFGEFPPIFDSIKLVARTLRDVLSLYRHELFIAHRRIRSIVCAHI